MAATIRHSQLDDVEKAYRLGKFTSADRSPSREAHLLRKAQLQPTEISSVSREEGPIPKRLRHYENARSLQSGSPRLVSNLYIGVGRVHNETESDSQTTPELFNENETLIIDQENLAKLNDCTMAELCVTELSANLYRLLGKHQEDLACLKQAGGIYHHMQS